MTNPMTPEEIDERRAIDLYVTEALCSVLAGLDDVVVLEPERRIAHAIRQSDEENHIGYFNTETHVAVPRKMTRTMQEAALAASPFKDGNEGHINTWIYPMYRAAILAAQEDDK